MKYKIEYTLKEKPNPVTMADMPSGVVCHIRQGGVVRQGFIREDGSLHFVGAMGANVSRYASDWAVIGTIGDNPVRKPGQAKPRTAEELVPGDAWMLFLADGRPVVRMVVYSADIANGNDALLVVRCWYVQEYASVTEHTIPKRDVGWWLWGFGTPHEYIGRLDPINPDVRFVQAGD